MYKIIDLTKKKEQSLILQPVTNRFRLEMTNQGYLNCSPWWIHC